MEIIKTPWKKELLQLVSDSKESIKITSPYLTYGVCKEVFDVKKKGVDFKLITAYTQSSLIFKSVDIRALEHIIKNKGIVKNRPGLHSKIYLFDDKKAIVTSGNFTTGGTVNNHEYGVYFEDKKLIKAVSKEYETLYKSPHSSLVRKEHIAPMHDTVRALQKKAKSIKATKFDFEKPELNSIEIDFSTKDIESSLKGWTLDAYKIINSIPTQHFTAAEVYSFEAQLKKLYPTNNFIKAQLRKQLQILRNLGLIEFVSRGKYRKQK